MGASDRLPVETLPLLVAAGYVNIDVTAYVTSLPGRDGRVTGAHVTRTLGGMSANMVSAAAGLGAPWPLRCELISTVGRDADSDWTLAELAERGVGTGWMAKPQDGRVTYCLIMVEPGGHRAIISEPMAFHEEQVARCLSAGSDMNAQTPRLLHTEGYRVPSLLDQVARARSMGWRTSIDLDGLPAEWRTQSGLLQLAGLFDVIFINREVAQDVWPDPVGDEGWQAGVAAQLQAMPGPMGAEHSDWAGNILFTLGADGLLVVPKDGTPPVRIEGTRVESVDTTGAGDVFAGCFLAMWLNGLGVEQAARYASIAAALSTTGMGAQGMLPTGAQVLAYITTE